MMTTEDHRYVVEEVNRALVRSIGRPMRVLDVGCGVGLNGLFARKRGAQVSGIEIAQTALPLARAHLHEVFSFDIESAEAVATGLGERRFDLLLFGDVLEHVRDPEAVLKHFMAFLEPEGHVIVSLPNVAAWTVRLALLSGRWNYERSGILDATHLRFFTRESAERLLEGVGLSVMRVDHNPMLVRALKHRVMSMMRPDESSPLAFAESLPYKAYEAFVRPIEDALVRRAPELLSFQHVLVARKPPVARKLSIVVGMLTMDEEESIERMIDQIRAALPDAQILCVDSSKDRTPELAAKKGVRVLRQVPPRGHGPAMEVLMYTAAATADALIYLDCDFTYPVAALPLVRDKLEQEAFDVVNCTRTRTRPAAMPLPNFLANRSFAALAHALHGVPTTDVHSGMRAYRSSVIRAFDFDGEGDALPIDTLLYPAKCGYRVLEMPIDYDERVGVSKLRKVAGTVWSLIRLGRPQAFRMGARGAPRYDVR